MRRQNHARLRSSASASALACSISAGHSRIPDGCIVGPFSVATGSDSRPAARFAATRAWKLVALAAGSGVGMGAGVGAGAGVAGRCMGWGGVKPQCGRGPARWSTGARALCVPWALRFATKKIACCAYCISLGGRKHCYFPSPPTRQKQETPSPVPGDEVLALPPRAARGQTLNENVMPRPR